jgi:Ca2+-binding EF-hand superfamily protein
MTVTLCADLVVSRQEFTCNNGARALVPSRNDELREAFRLFDISSNGFISLQDFVTSALCSCPALSKDTLEAAFREADREHGGRVSFGQFEKLMTFPLN